MSTIHQADALAENSIEKHLEILKKSPRSEWPQMIEGMPAELRARLAARLRGSPVVPRSKPSTVVQPCLPSTVAAPSAMMQDVSSARKSSSREPGSEEERSKVKKRKVAEQDGLLEVTDSDGKRILVPDSVAFVQFAKHIMFISGDAASPLPQSTQLLASYIFGWAQRALAGPRDTFQGARLRHRWQSALPDAFQEAERVVESHKGARAAKIMIKSKKSNMPRHERFDWRLKFNSDRTRLMAAKEYQSFQEARSKAQKLQPKVLNILPPLPKGIPPIFMLLLKDRIALAVESALSARSVRTGVVRQGASIDEVWTAEGKAAAAAGVVPFTSPLLPEFYEVAIAELQAIDERLPTKEAAEKASEAAVHTGKRKR